MQNLTRPGLAVRPLFATLPYGEGLARCLRERSPERALPVITRAVPG